MSEPGSSLLLFRELPPHLQFSREEKRALRAFAREAGARVLAQRARLTPRPSCASSSINQRSFTCVLSDDKELRQLNASFLGHDYATDVLSFPGSDGCDNAGELIISVERAGAQAEQFGHDRIDEIRILMLHGLLHLAGMDHEHDRGEMARAEDHWREAFGLPNALIGRTR